MQNDVDKLWEELISKAEDAVKSENYDAAAGALFEAIEVVEQFGETDKRFIYTLDKLAECLWYQGKLVEAENYCKQLMRIHESVINAEAIDVASYMNNLALIKHFAKQFDEAEKYYKRALRAKTQILGEDHQTVLRLKSNYADLLMMRGKEDEARKMSPSSRVVTVRDWQSSSQMKSLENARLAREPVIDLTPDAAPSRQKTLSDGDITNMLQSNKEAATQAILARKPEEAEKLLLRNLQILEGLKARREELIECLEHLGALAQAQHDYASAVQRRQRAYELKVEARGKEHPSTAESADALARLFYLISDYEKAEPYALHCVSAYREIHGPASRELASALHNLGTLYHVQRKYNEAEGYYKQALDLKMKIFGKNHSETTRLVRSYADILRQTNRQGELSKLNIDTQQMITGSWKVVSLTESESLTRVPE